MCQSIFVADEGREIHTLAELEAMIGGPFVDWLEPQDQALYEAGGRRKDCCLCGADILSTLVSHGYKVWQEQKGDPMEYLCESA